MLIDDPNRILFLFERMCEPVFMPKGSNNVIFDIPVESISERYRPYVEEFAKRWNDGTELKIPVNKIIEPDMTIPLELGRYETFSLFIPEHRKIAGRLINIFMGIKTFDDLVAVAVCWRDRLNPHLFVYGLSVALLHREDTKNIALPPLSEIFPDKFVDRGIFLRAKEEANLIPEGSRTPIVLAMDSTGSSSNQEHRVAYWREDIGINLHHWHWHLVYPFYGDLNIVNKDRRGELFYYMHQQMLARYNSERFCNNLGRPRRLDNFHDVLPEGYYPKLDSLVAGKTWPGRPNGLRLNNLDRPVDKLHLDMTDLERWRDRIVTAIKNRYVINDKGETILLNEQNGIDILGNMIEASILTPNKNIYGDLHNQGHLAIAYVHDPDGQHQETFAVMGDSATSMRDPAFYRWHTYLNDIFLEHKATLPTYGVERLDFPGIGIINCQIITPTVPPNTLMTFWNQSDIDLSNGLDFHRKGDVLVRITHLNHAEFKYQINAMNTTGFEQIGIVRIFISPKVDEHGLPFTFRVQKDLMIEMDKFVVTLRPGSNIITRDSVSSSVTIPYETTFRDLNSNATLSPQEKAGFTFCGCGWPQHMLVPKGRLEGYPMELFVMISNAKNDLISQAPPVGCSEASSYCGLRDRKYPDARSMGYPFDRKPRLGVQTLAEFLTPNMKTAEIKVRFTDAVIPRYKKTPRLTN